MTTDGPRRVFTQEEAEARLIGIEKAHQLGGHTLSPSALDRARRILLGQLILDDARAEILGEFSEEP